MADTLFPDGLCYPSIPHLPAPLLLSVSIYAIHSVKWCLRSLPKISFSFSLAAFRGAPWKGRIVSQGHAWFVRDDWEPAVAG
ncbi:hypothetical protein PAXRUDRAFT_22750 [Paxillus rubicundulus Ve08.2h10]|uniref:Uncharacterized protein n=1 Tax=Paxillus rubicundulus Ve08.2h10 TaxID=930991 RepID=A0A0D0CMN4_9AGAM|nr:hypothetical protein PAXRUDRAFT_22750 [Paxillus rubicundulus Ve08.2h10]